MRHKVYLDCFVSQKLSIFLRPSFLGTRAGTGTGTDTETEYWHHICISNFSLTARRTVTGSGVAGIDWKCHKWCVNTTKR